MFEETEERISDLRIEKDHKKRKELVSNRDTILRQKNL